MLAHPVVREAKLAFRQRGENLGCAISEPEIRVTVIHQNRGVAVRFAGKVTLRHTVISLLRLLAVESAN